MKHKLILLFLSFTISTFILADTRNESIELAKKGLSAEAIKKADSIPARFYRDEAYEGIIKALVKKALFDGALKAADKLSSVTAKRLRVIQIERIKKDYLARKKMADAQRPRTQAEIDASWEKAAGPEFFDPLGGMAAREVEKSNTKPPVKVKEPWKKVMALRRSALEKFNEGKHKESYDLLIKAENIIDAGMDDNAGDQATEAINDLFVRTKQGLRHVADRYLFLAFFFIDMMSESDYGSLYNYYKTDAFSSLAIVQYNAGFTKYLQATIKYLRQAAYHVSSGEGDAMIGWGWGIPADLPGEGQYQVKSLAMLGATFSKINIPEDSRKAFEAAEAIKNKMTDPSAISSAQTDIDNAKSAIALGTDSLAPLALPMSQKIVERLNSSDEHETRSEAFLALAQAELENQMLAEAKSHLDIAMREMYSVPNYKTNYRYNFLHKIGMVYAKAGLYGAAFSAAERLEESLGVEAAAPFSDIYVVIISSKAKAGDYASAYKLMYLIKKRCPWHRARALQEIAVAMLEAAGKMQ